MERLSEILLEFYKAFTESPFKFVVFIVLCAGLYLLYAQTETIMSYLPTPAKENAQFELSLERDALVNESLQSASEFLNAESVVLSQFHNGQYDLTRLPFTKVSVTYFAGDTGLEPDALYNPRPISSMNVLMLNMWKDKESPTCISREVEELKDIGYRMRMVAAGKKFVSLCPITNIRNYPIGYFAVAYNYVPAKEDIPILMDYQKTLANRVAGYLQEGAITNARD